MRTLTPKTSCENAIHKFWGALTDEQKSVLGKDIALKVGITGSSNTLMKLVQDHVASMGLFSDPVEQFANVYDTYIALPDTEKKFIRDRLAEYFLKHNANDLNPKKAWDYKAPTSGVLLAQTPVATQPGRLDITASTTIPLLLSTEVPPKEITRH